MILWVREHLRVKILEWTHVERQYLQRLYNSEDHLFLKLMKTCLLLGPLLLSRIFFLSPLSPLFYALFTYSVLSVLSTTLPLWLFSFILTYLVLMLYGTQIFLTTSVSPYIRNNLDTFLYGADIRAHFFGNYCSTHAKAFMSVLLLATGFYLQYQYEEDNGMTNALMDLEHMEKNNMLLFPHEKLAEILELWAQQHRENGICHRAARADFNIMATAKAVMAFFGSK